MIIRQTPWNDEVIGGKTVEIFLSSEDNQEFAAQVDVALSEVKSSDVIFAQLRLDSCVEKRALLEKRGFRFIDISYELIFNQPQRLDVTWRIPTGIDLCLLSCDAELEFARQVAVHDFEFGRLLEDPNIDRNAARDRTGRWINHLCQKPYKFYIAKYRGNPIGFHAELIHSDYVEWILTGVARHYSMLAPKMWQEVFLLAQKNRYKKICTIISASNVGVLNVYNMFPFRVSKALFGFHWHR